MESGPSKLKPISNRYCSVPQCKSRATSEVSLFLFPKDDELKKEWARVLRIDKPVSKFMYVCSLHFIKNDFFLPEFPTKRRCLKKGVIPSQNIPLYSIQVNDKMEKNKTTSSRRKKNYENLIKIEDMPSTSYFEEVNIATQEHNESYIERRISEESEESSIEEIIFDDDSELEVPIMQDATTADEEMEFHKINSTIFDLIKTNKQLDAFTGIPCFKMLDDIVKDLKQAEGSSIDTKLSVLHRVMLVCIKLKLNLSFVCLSAFFQITENSCKNYFYLTIQSLRLLLEHTIHLPDKENLPACFVGTYDDTRIVLNCTEILIEKFDCSTKNYSQYRDNESIKIMIGCTPSGVVSYVSEAHGGQTSDETIFVQSRLSQKCIPGKDAIMIDTSLQIEAECARHNIKLIRPTFLKTLTQSDDTSVRLHIERCVQRFKIFEILKGPICQNVLPYIDDIMIVIAGIVNLSQPILADDKFIL